MIATIAMIGGLCHQEVVQAAEEAAQQEAPFKLRATFQEQGGKLVPESPQRFQAEQAANAYANGKLAEAERRYREALRLAEANGKLDAESDALLKTNLAAVLRDEKKSAESEKYFGQAIDVAIRLLDFRCVEIRVMRWCCKGINKRLRVQHRLPSAYAHCFISAFSISNSVFRPSII